ncbi:MAG TPA: hypothetical protein VIS06_13675 [Mycobacteriales bacterium]
MRIRVTIDPGVLAASDTEARAAGLSRSAWSERVGRGAAVRSSFDRFNPPGGVEGFPVEMRDRISAVGAYWDSMQTR